MLYCYNAYFSPIISLMCLYVLFSFYCLANLLFDIKPVARFVKTSNDGPTHV